jgi:type II secretory pathway component PulM
MNRSQSLSAWFRRLSRRERRVVVAGALVSALALLVVWGVLPFLRRWQDRETMIAERQMQLAQMQSLIEGEADTRQRLAARQRDRAALRARLLTGTTPALAASSLQALLQEYADGSRIALERVDLVTEPRELSSGKLRAIPVQLSGRGDIYGLADLLVRLQYGEKLLVIDELRVTGIGTDQAPELLNLSVRLHGAYGGN